MVVCFKLFRVDEIISWGGAVFPCLCVCFKPIGVWGVIWVRKIQLQYMNPTTIRVGGVPEHFNFPWHLAAEHQLYQQYGFEMHWQDYPGGTGAMCRALREGELDLAVVLTEGAVADIVKGSPARIVGTYVQSPLIWGVHVSAQGPIQHPATLEGQRFAVSRYGSGSHLMALVHAQQSGWVPGELDFEVVGNFDGAREALAQGQADAFMWEKYTTKPTVDRGEWNRLGEVRTEWPCFVMLGTPKLFSEHSEELESLMFLIRRSLHLLTHEQLMQYLASHYQLAEQDLEAWYAQTEWLIRPQIELSTLERVQRYLQEAGVIEAAVPSSDLVAPLCQVAQQRLSAVMYDWRVASTYQMLALKGKATGPLDIGDLTDLGHLDQYHYLGEETSRAMAALLDLKPGQRVLDIGSGVGGTARIMAREAQCEVVGIELQDDLNRLADDLTRRVGLQDRVSYLTADFMQYQPAEPFDHFISLLVFLHLPDRPAVLRKCFDLLKPGGRFVIEDLAARHGAFTGLESTALRHTVSALSVTDPAAYLAELQAAGFTDLEVVDMTPQWQPWTEQRYQHFIAQEDFNRPFFGEKVYNNRRNFYRTISELFQGNLGGVRITGRKPA